MISLINKTKHKINIKKLKKYQKQITNRDIELLIVSKKKMKKLNFDYRNKDKATDVLSFPLDIVNCPECPLGSIVICYSFVKKYAKKHNHSRDDELALLFIHGLLHLVGYDHEIDDGEHRKEEKRLVKQFGLPKSLIIRNS